LTTSIYYGYKNEQIYTSVPPIRLHSLHKDNFIFIPAPKKKESNAKPDLKEETAVAAGHCVSAEVKMYCKAL